MIVTGDFETFYSQDYSLSKMSEIDYVLDPRFEVIMCAVKEGDGQSEAAVGYAAVAARFAKIDWSRAAWLSHNTRFDGSILAWRFGIKPALYLDTLGMARAMTHATLGRSSLKAVSDYLGLPPKGDEVVQAKGKTLSMFTRDELERYIDYCLRDNDNCYDIFRLFMQHGFPKAELPIIDAALRMFIEPRVKLDPTVLAEHLHAVRAEKEALFARVASIDKSVFSSNQKFASLLEEHGVEVPMKISPATRLPTPAMAKNDRAFKELCEDPTQPPIVQAICAARIGAKSTSEETRTLKLLDLSLREWGAGEAGWAPIPLKYFGAHTGRFSGDGGFNWQNFARSSRIKEAIEAPPGYRIVHRDSSQIEARGVALLAGQEDLLQAFEQGRDVYSEFASDVYGRVVTKRDTKERFVGKTSILGLGYGMGPPRFIHTLFIGNGGICVSISEEEARRIVYQHYRRKYDRIPALWDTCEHMLGFMRHMPPGERTPAPANMAGILELSSNAIWLPNGLCIQYPNLRVERRVDKGGAITIGFVYDGPYGANDIRHLFGGKVTENIDQALARVVITDTVNRVRGQTGFLPFLSTHDSLDYLVPETQAEQFDGYLETEFARRPTWAPRWPLASEGGWGRTLADAEAHRNN